MRRFDNHVSLDGKLQPLLCHSRSEFYLSFAERDWCFPFSDGLVVFNKPRHRCQFHYVATIYASVGFATISLARRLNSSKSAVDAWKETIWQGCVTVRFR